MKSMTGYAAATFETEELQSSLEIKSVNNRYLDIYLHLPRYLSAYEMDIREMISAKVSRGKLNLSIEIKLRQNSAAFTVNEDFAELCYQGAQHLASKLNLENDLSVSKLLLLPGILEPENKIDSQQIWQELQPQIENLIERFDQVRADEGAATRRDLLNNLQIMEDMCTQIKQSAKGYTDDLQGQLQERLTQLVSDRIDTYLILQEAAIIAGRADINEELSRLENHFRVFRETVYGGEPAGRKLDFLTQEINREVNTVGSKQHKIQISETVVELKSSLEKIKEQIRNVE